MRGFLVKSADWRTDGLGIYKGLTNEFGLELMVGIYDGWIDELWLMDLVVSKTYRLSDLGKPCENARWFSRVWNPRGQLLATLV